MSSVIVRPFVSMPSRCAVVFDEPTVATYESVKTRAGMAGKLPDCSLMRAMSMTMAPCRYCLMASGTGKNNANTGIRIVQRPNPENRIGL